MAPRASAQGSHRRRAYPGAMGVAGAGDVAGAAGAAGAGAVGAVGAAGAAGAAAGAAAGGTGQSISRPGWQPYRRGTGGPTRPAAAAAPWPGWPLPSTIARQRLPARPALGHWGCPPTNPPARPENRNSPARAAGWSAARPAKIHPPTAACCRAAAPGIAPPPARRAANNDCQTAAAAFAPRAPAAPCRRRSGAGWPAAASRCSGSNAPLRPGRTNHSTGLAAAAGWHRRIARSVRNAP